MNRDLAAMASRGYDLVVIGGGITGACIARDAAMRGMSVALVDKGDFGHATTAASSKLIHGGLRYLQYLQLGVVRESLRERRIWAQIAPHMVDPLVFLVPTWRSRRRRALELSLALTAYDLLSFDRNRLSDQRMLIPSHRFLNRDEVLALEPGLNSEDLDGAMLFTDYQMYFPERLALECVLDAATYGAEVANYVCVERFIVEGARVCGVMVRDLLDASREHVLRGAVVINAGGAWADILMAKLGMGERHRHLVRSKGIHLLTRAITKGHAIGIQTRDAHFFILPWRGHSLIGTTDVVFQGEPDDCTVQEQDILDFLAVVNEAYPAGGLSREDVLHSYAGLRPIIDMDMGNKRGGGTYRASRAAEVYDHEAQEHIGGCITAIGGKWTTSRNLAKKVVDLAASKLGRSYASCQTETTPTYGGSIGPFCAYCDAAIREKPGHPETLVRHFVKNYGGHWKKVLAISEEHPTYYEPLSRKAPDIGAQVIYAVRHEMARTLEDVLLRRTGLGNLGPPDKEVIARVTSLMAEELGWSGLEIEKQSRQYTSGSKVFPTCNLGQA